MGDLVFPVAGRYRMADSFGDPRSGGRRHAGVDIMAPKGTPVVAVASGTVRWMYGAGGRCCSLALTHDDGWRSRYVHLNNDTPGTDDGRAVGIVSGLAPGVRVERGELLGWVGDSGNAESTASHLHFELRTPEGEPVDPHGWLLAAVHVVPPEDRGEPLRIARGPDGVAGDPELEGSPLPGPEPGRGWRSGWASLADPALEDVAWTPRPAKGRGWGWSCGFLAGIG